jgi:HEAT repeat protein
MGADGKDSLPAMRKLLKHDNRNLRLWTAIAIGKIDGSADVVPQLIEVLKTEPGYHIRRSSLDANCTIGPAAKDALPVLRKIAADAEDDLQDSAKDAILRIERR